MEIHFRKMLMQLGDLADIAASEKIAHIPMTKGMFAIVDKEFEIETLRYRWYTSAPQVEHIYAVADIGGRRISLQRLIWHLANSERDLASIKNVSFHNKCSLDCRILNLLDQVDRQAVMQNRRKKRTSSSNYKGLRKRLRQDGTIVWFAGIRVEGGDLSLGVHEDEVFAAKVYDAAAYLFFGQSAHLNFLNEAPNLAAIDVVLAHYARATRKKDQ